MKSSISNCFLLYLVWSDFWSFWASGACSITYRSWNRTLQRIWVCPSQYLVNCNISILCFLYHYFISLSISFVVHLSLLNLNMLRRLKVWMVSLRLRVGPSRYVDRRNSLLMYGLCRPHLSEYCCMTISTDPWLAFWFNAGFIRYWTCWSTRCWS